MTQSSRAERSPCAPDAGRFVPPVSRPSSGRLLHIPLHLADRPLVAPGQPVELGQPIVEHFREQQAVEVASSAGVIGIPPGSVLDNVPAESSGRLGRRSSETTYRTRVLRARARRRHAAGGRHGGGRRPRARQWRHRGGHARPASTCVPRAWHSMPASAGAVPPWDGCWWPSTRPTPRSRPRASTSRAAGAILVVGSRIDIEALSRARAIGAAAVITGGVASRDLRQLVSSEARQQAALHAAAPFGLVALSGYGRASIPRHLWDLLVAADGRQAGLLPALAHAGRSTAIQRHCWRPLPARRHRACREWRPPRP